MKTYFYKQNPLKEQKYIMYEDWKPSAEHYTFITQPPRDWIHDDKTGLDYLYWAEFQNEIKIAYVLFKGSSETKDWVKDFEFFPKRLNLFPGTHIRVHCGIGEQYLAGRNQILDFLYQEKPSVILISGYSLGGGLTQIAAEDITWHFRETTISAIAYESPRVWFMSARLVKPFIENKLTLIMTWWDPVVHLPLFIFGFKFVGKKIWIGKLNRLIPVQHLWNEVVKNLMEKFSVSGLTI
ncbi:MAG: lipase family protein [Endomicrobium sp.]|jgi:hypothetical protein|nr:lipase family protein [Endomicrobium sp.]